MVRVSCASVVAVLAVLGAALAVLAAVRAYLASDVSLGSPRHHDVQYLQWRADAPTPSSTASSSAATTAANMTSSSVADVRPLDRRKLIVLATERSGSTMLAWMLDAHPDVYCMGEVFNMYTNQRKPYNFEPSAAIHRNWSAHVDVLDGIYSGRIRRVKDLSMPLPAVVGFKQQYQYADPAIRPQLVRWIAANNVSVVHLIRRNVFEQYLSLAAALRTNVYNIGQRATVPAETLAPMVVNWTEFAAYAESVAQNVTYFREHLTAAAAAHYTEVVYESLAPLDGRQRVLQTLFAFLGVRTDFQSETWLRKMNDRRCSERTLNWNDIGPLLKASFPDAYALCNNAPDHEVGT